MFVKWISWNKKWKLVFQCLVWCIVWNLCAVWKYFIAVVNNSVVGLLLSVLKAQSPWYLELSTMFRKSKCSYWLSLLYCIPWLRLLPSASSMLQGVSGGLRTSPIYFGFADLYDLCVFYMLWGNASCTSPSPKLYAFVVKFAAASFEPSTTIRLLMDGSLDIFICSS